MDRRVTFAFWAIDLLLLAGPFVMPNVIPIEIAWLAVILAAAMLVYALFPRRIITMATKFIGGSIINRANAPAAVSEAPIDLIGTELASPTASLILRNGEGSNLTGTSAEGLARGSVGFDLENSPNTNLTDTVSRNNDTGFRLRASGGSDLSRARAERDEPQPAGRSYHVVKLPEGMAGPQKVRGIIVEAREGAEVEVHGNSMIAPGAQDVSHIEISGGARSVKATNNTVDTSDQDALSRRK